MQTTKTLRSRISGTFTTRDLSALGAPVAWQGTVSAAERAAQEADCDALIEEARLAIEASGGHAVEIQDGQIVATVHETP